MSWAEAKVIDVKLCIHSLRSKVPEFRAIVACTVEGALLFVANEATKE